MTLEEKYDDLALATPALPTTINLTVDESNPEDAVLSYRVSASDPWTTIAMSINPYNATRYHLTAVVPSLPNNTVYWKAFINDTAGNNLIIDNNGQPYSYKRPEIELNYFEEPVTEFDVGAGEALEIVITVEDQEYVDYLVISYCFDDGVMKTANMTYNSSTSAWSYVFQDIASNVTVLSYNISAIDIYGNTLPPHIQHVLDLIPPLPEWNISEEQQVPIILVSLVIGLVSGVIFSIIVRRKKPVREMVEKLEEREKPGSVYKNITVSIGITAAIIVFMILLAFVGLYVYNYPEAAMLALAGALLAIVVLWMLLASRSITKTLMGNKTKFVGLPLMFIVGFSIFIVLLGIMFIGNQVPWWSVRVNEQSYNIGGFSLPSMFTSLASTFFSSIIVLTWSISRNTKRVQRELLKAAELNVNPGFLIEKKQTEISLLMNSVGFKGLLFVGIIGSTIIFASDLSSYAGQGLLLILPFVIGTVIMLGLSALVQRRRLKSKEIIIYDNLTTCPSCQQETAMGGSFCENCGAKMIVGKRKANTTKCSHCDGVDPIEAVTCRYCGRQMGRDREDIILNKE
ncbi:MAG: zinc ribbon domain-containing protein [Promethearchaeota archaeon]